MELVVEEATVTIKVMSVNGRRMPKAIYNQLPRRSLLSDHGCTVQGRPWGTVIDPKCCHDVVRRRPHWHVLHEQDGELAVWNLPKDIADAGYNLQPGGPYEPRSRIDRDFLDACALETHRGDTHFFQGSIFDLIRDEQITTTIEDITVHLMCSRDVVRLRDARKEHASAAKWTANWPDNPPTRRTEKAEAELAKAENAMAELYEHRGRSAQELYADVVADVRRIKQARVNYIAAQEMAGQLPQLFLGA